MGRNSTYPCENSTRWLVSRSRYSRSVQHPCAGYRRAISHTGSPYVNPARRLDLLGYGAHRVILPRSSLVG